jgi:hypothetical protein
MATTKSTTPKKTKRTTPKPIRTGRVKGDNGKGSAKPRTRGAPRGRPSVAAHGAVTKPTKKQICIDLLGRRNGATNDELRRATGWQAHSVRGFISRTIKTMPGTELVVDIPDDGPRRYRIVAKHKNK